MLGPGSIPREPLILDMDINKNVLSLAAIVVAFSIGYYFVVFLPANKEAEALSLNKSKCAQAAGSVFSAYKKDSASGPLASRHYSSHYSTKLDKCYVEITDNFAESTGVSILDATENRELTWALISADKTQGSLYASVGINGDNTDITKEQFETLEKQYLSE